MIRIRLCCAYSLQQRTAVVSSMTVDINCLFNPFDYSLLQSDRLDPIGFVNSTGRQRLGREDSESVSGERARRLSSTYLK